MQLRVVVVASSMVYREGLVSVLTREGCAVVGQATTVAGGVEAVAQAHPDCVLVDVRMPPTHTDEGVRLARALRARHPRIGIVLLADDFDAALASQLLDGGRGSIGYVLKQSIDRRDVLAETLRRVATRRPVVDTAIVHSLARRREERAALGELSGAERRVLAMIAEGHSNEGIAEALLISERTVDAHVRAIMRKLDLKPSGALNRRVMAALRWLECEEVAA